MPPSPSLPWHQAHCASKVRRPSAASADVAERAERGDAVRVWATDAAGSNATADAAQITEWSSRIILLRRRRVQGSAFRVQGSGFRVQGSCSGSSNTELTRTLNSNSNLER